MKNTGEDFDITDDSNILKIDSPAAHLLGPYTVVFKNIDERWAIVTLEWDGNPRLGIRWFFGNGGNPFSSGNGTWLVIPPSLSKNILAGLPIDHAIAGRLDDFLCRKIKWDQLIA